MTEEFVLDKFIFEDDEHKGFFRLDIENVKEFIKQEGYLLQAYIQGEITWMKMCDKRRKLIGGELLK